MTANKRIFLNIIATYGRSLYALAVGLFSSRWVLMTLGQTDYGLFGVVGGLVAFVAFFNTIMAGSVGRFYAYAVGQTRRTDTRELRLDECRRWFSIAVAIHTSLPVVLTIIGWPVGEWAVCNILVIPPDRVAACLWVWRFSCVACFFSMVNVPFQAMYTAKQEIAELTIYSFATTTLNFIFLYYAVSHPGDWLVRYSCWTCFLSVTPQLLICLRACLVYQECRFSLPFVWDGVRFKKILSYAGARFFGAFATIFTNQGTALLVNRYLGPMGNAAMTVANSASSHALTLSNSLSGALWPAITNAAGEKRRDVVIKLSNTACKFGAILVLIFAIPLSVEIQWVMRIWLKTPPAGADFLCTVLLYVLAVDKMTDGLWMSIFAEGKIAAYEITIGIVGASLLFIVWFFLGLGWGVVAYGVARAIGKIPSVVIRLHYAHKIVGINPWIWIKTIGLPILFCTVLSVLVSLLPRVMMGESFVRTMLSTALTWTVFIPCIWFFSLDLDEKAFVATRVKKFTGGLLTHG